MSNRLLSLQIDRVERPALPPLQANLTQGAMMHSARTWLRHARQTLDVASLPPRLRRDIGLDVGTVAPARDDLLGSEARRLRI